MDQLGLAIAILSTFMLGSNKIAVRKSLFDIDESLASFIAIFVAIPIFGLPILIFGWGTGNLTFSVVLIFAIAGVLNYSAGRYFIWKSIGAIGANRGNTLASSQVLYAIIIAIVFLGQRVDLVSGIGIIFVLAGIFIISYRSFSNTPFSKKELRIGIISGILGGFLWGISQVLMQIGISEYSNATSASFITFVAGLIGILPFLYAANRLSSKSAFRVTKKGVFYAIIGGLLGTFGLFFRYVALETIPLTIVSTINGTNPIVTLVLSYFLIRNVEYIDRRTIVGIVASAVGVAFLSY